MGYDSLLDILQNMMAHDNCLKAQCHAIFYSGIFIKQLLLVPLDKPRMDFKFFPIIEELFMVLIGSPVYSSPGS